MGTEVTFKDFEPPDLNIPAPAVADKPTHAKTQKKKQAELRYTIDYKDANDKWRVEERVRDKMIACIKSLAAESILNACKRHSEWSEVEDKQNLTKFLSILSTVCWRQGSGVQYNDGIDSFKQHPKSTSNEFRKLLVKVAP